MYIGKLGDGTSADDGIYVLLKEVLDNCIDEHTMGYGKQVEVGIEKGVVTIRDFGRGIPLGRGIPGPGAYSTSLRMWRVSILSWISCGPWRKPGRLRWPSW